MKRTDATHQLSRRAFVGGTVCGGLGLMAGRVRAEGDASLLISNCTERLVDQKSDANTLDEALQDTFKIPASTLRSFAPLGAGPSFAPGLGGGPLSGLSATDIPDAPQQIALTKSQLWEQSISTLKIKIAANVRTEIRDAIDNAIATWGQHVPFDLKPSDSSPDITINFLQQGHWSYVGKSSRGNPHSMNIQPLNGERYGRVVLHEFGHALGAVHEHQSPNSGIPWNKPAVYEYYFRTQGWGKGMVDQQVLDKYTNGNEFNASSFDPTSIMQYPVPAELLLNGASAISWNDTLSPLDIQFMRSSYGLDPQPTGTGTTSPETAAGGDDRRAKLRAEDAVQIAIGETKPGTIKEPGELALYRIDVTGGKKSLVVETVDSPASDMVVELFSGAPFSADKALKVSEKLQGRSLLNAYLEAELDNGPHFLLVRHSVYTRTAGYQLHLRNASDAPAGSWNSRVADAKKIQTTINDIQSKFLTAPPR